MKKQGGGTNTKKTTTHFEVRLRLSYSSIYIPGMMDVEMNNTQPDTQHLHVRMYESFDGEDLGLFFFALALYTRNSEVTKLLLNKIYEIQVSTS